MTPDETLRDEVQRLRQHLGSLEDAGVALPSDTNAVGVLQVMSLLREARQALEAGASAARLRGMLDAALDAVITTVLPERHRARLDAERLASIVQSSTDAIYALSLDGTIVAWNASAERMFGFTRDEAVGRLREDRGWRSLRPRGDEPRAQGGIPGPGVVVGVAPARRRRAGRGALGDRARSAGCEPC
jgi:PAS domain-containing protein